VVLDFLSAFFLTNLLEMPVAYAVLRGKERTGRILAVVFLANVITLPFVWFLFPAIIGGYYTSLALSELFAFLFEAAAYALAFRKAGAMRAAGAAVLANALSLAVGLVL